MKHLIQRHFLPAICVATLLLSTNAALAREQGQDHPAVSRYPGAQIKDYDFKEFEQAQLILSKPRKQGTEYIADKVLPVEGAVTYIHYEVNGQVSALQLFRNYQSMLRRGGFNELFVCERPCINDNLRALKNLLGARSLYLNGFQDIQYVAAQRGNTYVSLSVNSMGNTTDAWLFVIDKGTLNDGVMGVSGNSPMALALNSHGRVDVYGFTFDTGKAQLKANSSATLNELAQVLQDNPGLNIQIVGHTDNVGQEASNQQLSQDRAQAVANALSQQRGINAARLQAIGRGASQPVAPNTSEAERARNRRVEIVALTPATTQVGKPMTPGNPHSQDPSQSADSGTKGVMDQARDAVNSTNELVKGINSLRGLFGR